LAVKPIKYGISTGVGLVHVGTLLLDERQGWTEPFKRASDYPQLIGFGVGLAIDALDIGPEEGEIGEALALSSLPLLTRSIYEAVRHYVGGGAKKVIARKGRWKLIKEGRVIRAVKEGEQEAPTVVPSPLIGL